MYCREYMYWKEENVEIENTEINFDADSGSAFVYQKRNKIVVF